MRKKAIILLSGGLDSTTVLAIAKHEGFDLFTMSFFYGQRHFHELNAAKKIAEIFKVKNHLEINIDLNKIGGSALTGDIKVPKARSLSSIKKGIPVTYVPARNTIFLAHALAWAEVIKSFDIFIGVNAIDFSGYPDCRPQYIKAFERMANLATKAGVEGKKRTKINTPLIKMTKAQIIRKGIELGVDYSLTRSCYDPGAAGSACGLCDSCFLRKKGFEEAGITDPARYNDTT